jgi:ribosomal RNA-processing protein 36
MQGEVSLGQRLLVASQARPASSASSFLRALGRGPPPTAAAPSAAPPAAAAAAAPPASAAHASKKRKRAAGAPQEMPTTRAVGRLRNVVGAVDLEARRRDPRFEAASGEFDAHHFERHFAFVDELRASEVSALRTELKRAADPEERERLRDLHARMRQQLSQRRQQKALADVLQRERRARREAVSAGRAPFFPKRAEIRELAAVERFAAVEREGGQRALNKLIERKRKKLQGKDKKRMLPMMAARRGAAGGGAGSEGVGGRVGGGGGGGGGDAPPPRRVR